FHVTGVQTCALPICADVLRRGAGDDAAALDRDLDLHVGLPQIEPVAGGDADAAAVAAGLLWFAIAPDVEPGSPVVQPLAVGIGEIGRASCRESGESA